MVNNLITQASKENLPSDITEQMAELDNMVKSNKMEIIKDSQKPIVIELRKELAARSNGRKSRVEVGLKYDHQFETALSILGDESVYSKLLNTIGN